MRPRKTYTQSTFMSTKIQIYIIAKRRLHNSSPDNLRSNTLVDLLCIILFALADKPHPEFGNSNFGKEVAVYPLVFRICCFLLSN